MTAALETLPRPTKQPKYVPIWKLINGFRRMRQGDFSILLDNATRIGETFITKVGTHRVFFLKEPELVEAMLVKNHKSYDKDRGIAALRRILGDGLLTSEGEFHLRQRRMIQPAFNKKRVDAYAECMVQYARDRATRWHDGEQLDMHVEMMNVTLAIIAKTMFNADVADEAHKVAHALDVIFAYQERYILPWLGRIFDALPLNSTRELHGSLRDLDAIMYRIIGEHRESGVDSGDLLSILLQAQDEDGGGGMPDRQIRDECITLFLAGHETTAVALSWTWYLLSQHPEVERRLHAELDSVLAGRAATADDIDKLVYTRQVIAESMRLYPPAYGFGRLALQDNELGPYHVRKGDTVVVSQFVMHRQPEWFPAPEVFDPDRWLPERAAGLHKFAYFPFGGGVRKCVGDNFAWMEGILLLATFAQEWKVRLAPTHKVGMEPKVTLRPRNGMVMTLHKRQPAESAVETLAMPAHVAPTSGTCPFGFSK